MESNDTKKKVAVVDLGAARTKVAIAWLSANELTIETTAVEVSLAEAALARDGSEIDKAVRRLSREVMEVIDSANAGRAVYLGAQAFRVGGAASQLVAAAERCFPNFSVLSPEQEAGIFFRDVGADRKSSNYVAIDVGGGSVQFAWGPEPNQCKSQPVGTFALEKDYQQDKSTAIEPGSKVWRSMRQCVLEAFRSEVSSNTSGIEVVIGSNVMASFFESAAHAASLDVGPGTLTGTAVRQLAHLIGGKPYSQSYFLFPEKPGFIHGADKLLVVIEAFMSLLNCDIVSGTNASTSRGMCRLLLDDPSALSAYSITVNRVGAH
jgi:hypothetical protein